MIPNTENQEVKLVHGIRGGIPSDRMNQIQARLLRSLKLRNLNPCLENPLVALGSQPTKKIQAHVRLSQGWHMLNEARSALIEAEACNVFYEEYEPNPVEAVYWCRFYLDDAILRLCSSLEHLLRCVAFYWDLRIPPPPNPASLVKVIKEAEKSSLPQVSGDVTTSLRALTTDTTTAKSTSPEPTDWEKCKKYRNDWVHNERPGIDGLGWEVLFKNGQDIPRAVLKELGYPATTSGKVVISVKTGCKIGELHRVVRNVYCQLFGVYERLAPLLCTPSSPPAGARGNKNDSCKPDI